MTDAEIIQSNFSLLRWINGTHEALVEKVGGPFAWKNPSDYVVGPAKSRKPARMLALRGESQW